MFDFLVSLLRSGGCSAANGPSPSPGTSQIVSRPFWKHNPPRAVRPGPQLRYRPIHPETRWIFLPKGQRRSETGVENIIGSVQPRGERITDRGRAMGSQLTLCSGRPNTGRVKGRPAFLLPVSGRLMSSRLLPLYILILMWTSCCASWETTCTFVTSSRCLSSPATLLLQLSFLLIALVKVGFATHAKVMLAALQENPWQEQLFFVHMFAYVCVCASPLAACLPMTSSWAATTMTVRRSAVHSAFPLKSVKVKKSKRLFLFL